MIMTNEEMTNEQVLEEIIDKILQIIAYPGEDYNDGECLDEIWVLLESNGYNPGKYIRRDYQPVSIERIEGK